VEAKEVTSVIFCDTYGNSVRNYIALGGTSGIILQACNIFAHCPTSLNVRVERRDPAGTTPTVERRNLH